MASKRKADAEAVGLPKKVPKLTARDGSGKGFTIRPIIIHA